jgi:hypothetical protein
VFQQSPLAASYKSGNVFARNSSELSISARYYIQNLKFFIQNFEGTAGVEAMEEMERKRAVASPAKVATAL